MELRVPWNDKLTLFDSDATIETMLKDLLHEYSCNNEALLLSQKFQLRAAS